MKNKKAVFWTTFIKIVIVVIVFGILLYTGYDLLDRTGKAALNLVKKERREFVFMSGSYIHPELVNSDLTVFWFKGFQDPIEAAVTTEEPCLGSFYIDESINMQETSLRFLQTDEGIEMMLLDAGNGAGIVDDTTFKNDENHDWKLCIIDPSADYNEIFHELELSFRLGHPFSIASTKTHENWITYLHDVTVSFKGKKFLESMGYPEAVYFTPEMRDKEGASSEIADYHPYPIGSDSPHDEVWAGPFDRTLFFYVIAGDNFCLLPTTWTKDKKNNALYLPDFAFLLKVDVFGKQKLEDGYYDSPAEDLLDFMDKPESEGVAQPHPAKFLDFLDSPEHKTFCKLPGGEDSEKASVFNGYNSCYYYSCYDIHIINEFLCVKIFSKCKGLCSSHGKPEKQGCRSCTEIKKCSKYKGGWVKDDLYFICTNDLCDFGCQYVLIDKKYKCIPEPIKSS